VSQGRFLLTETPDKAKAGELLQAGPRLSALGQSAPAGELGRAVVEEALRDCEERFRTIYTQSPVGIELFDDAGKLVDVNPACLDIFGLASADDVRGFDLFADPNVPAWARERCAAGESVAFESVLDFELVRQQDLYTSSRSGQSFVDCLITALHTSAGSLSGYLVHVRDVSERKRADAERRDLEGRLLQAQKLESLGVLAGGIAHDFNNLLTAILGNLEIVEEDISPLSPARRSVEQATAAARRAADLARQMLAFSGRSRFDLSRIDLGELVTDNAALLHTTISRSITLTLRSSAAPCVVEADPGQLQQLIVNLVTNASEAVGDGPGEVTLSTGVTHCDAATLERSRVDEKPAPGTYAYVEVSDTGSGMSEATLGRIFEPFFSTKLTGRGLGMSAVMGIVQGHKGAIMVSSAERKGTTVRVLLPVSGCSGPEAQPPAETSRSELADVTFQAGTVLIVDDEAVVRMTCRQYIERLGYRSLAAASGEEAVELYKAHTATITCVILDLTMPGMDGVATFSELRRHDPHVVVILSSGYAEEEALRLFAEARPAGFLQKPYRINELRTKIRAALDSTDSSAGSAPRE
jgi:PAS domain S-box-containing protein